MAGILSDKLETKVDKLRTYVQRKLLGLYGCDETARAAVVAEISARVSSETKVLLGNAISILSQDCMSRFAGNADGMQRYFDLTPEKKVKEKYQFSYDFAGRLDSIPGCENARLKSVGMGFLGATVGAFVARRWYASFLSPQVALVALAAAAICCFASLLLLSNVNKKRYETAVADAAGDLQSTILKWLDDIEKDFANIVASI